MKNIFTDFVNNGSTKKLGEGFFKSIAKSDSAFSGKVVKDKMTQVIQGTAKEYTGYYSRKLLKKTFVGILGGKGNPLANALSDQMTRLFAVPLRDTTLGVVSELINKKGKSGKSLKDAYHGQQDSMVKKIDGIRESVVKHGENNGFLPKGSYQLYNSDRRKAREEFVNLKNQASGDKDKHNETRNKLWKSHKKEVADMQAAIMERYNKGEISKSRADLLSSEAHTKTRYSKYKKSLRHRIDVRYERNRPKSGGTFHDKFTEPNYFKNKYIHGVKNRDPFHVAPK